MKIAQIVLEDAQFGHIGNFLAHPSSSVANEHNVSFSVQLVGQDDPTKAVVRLGVETDEEAQYHFSAHYLILLQLEADEVGAEPHRLAVTGATMLMPLLREFVGNLTMRGRFGQIWLPPMNFGAVIPDSSTEKAEPTKPAAKKKAARKKKARPAKS